MLLQCGWDELVKKREERKKRGQRTDFIYICMCRDHSHLSFSGNGSTTLILMRVYS